MHDFFVVLFLTEFNQRDCIVQPRVELRIGRESGVEMLAFAQKLLRALRIIPKGWVLNDRVQLLEPGLRLIPVKDTSARARGIA